MLCLGLIKRIPNRGEFDMLPSETSYAEVPRQVELVTELPLTATGKIRRKALRERELQRHHG